MTADITTGQDETTTYRYKSFVKKIRALPFEDINAKEVQAIWYLSWVAAVEFAEALRLSQRLYPDHPGLQAMILGELETTNLALDDFQEPADHHAFLEHFLRKHGVMEEMEATLGEHAARYLAACRSLDDHTRAMTVFSREEELAGIFARFLDAKDWSAPGVYAFKHYLSTHIVLDSSDGGHHDLVSDFVVDDAVSPFYEARFESFRLIPTLVESGAYAAA
jgi:hypothetical protein